MNRRNFVQAAALVPLLAGRAPLLSAAMPAANPEKNTAPDVSMTPIRGRFDLTLERALHGDSPSFTEEFLLADVKPTPERRFTEYSGDLSGRYIGALATAAQAYGLQFPSLDALVARVIALQKPDGYFGIGFHYDKPTDGDMALLWGNGRLLVGLLEYYRLRPSPAVLTACTRLGDFLVRIGPVMLSTEMREAFGAQHFASSYICWMQQTEGLSNLYVVTKDERYRKLAGEIAAVTERRPSDHVHGYLTSLRGVMDLYSATGDARLLRQCEAAWQEIAASKDLLITGGVPEGWSPNGHRTEGCAEADWVRLNLALWKASGDAKYLAMAERATFNELAFNQYASGDFGHHVYTDTGLPAGGAVRAWWCCTLHGLRCFPDVQASAFREREGGLSYELPIDGRIETAAVSAMAESSLARDGMVRIRITEAGAEPRLLRIRVPKWAHGLVVRLNGSLANFPADSGYVGTERVWRAGDVVEVNYAMTLRSTASGENRISYSYGPWLLGAPASQNLAYFNEMTTENKIVRGKEVARQAGQHSSLGFAVPIAATACPYIAAEFPDQPATVELRAIAEQTGQPTTSWELRLLTEEHG
ncbi:MAG TPA: beta-L-arabinofuranosidase domain-containing protein [Terracidiphilus sp.]|nr:beta-L-arabinofuranosidase domain-containing protein [Terracidiphilus sp.]